MPQVLTRKKQSSGGRIVRKLRQEEEGEVAEADEKEVVVVVVSRHCGKIELIPAKAWSWRCPPANGHVSVWRPTLALAIKKEKLQNGFLSEERSFIKRRRGAIGQREKTLSGCSKR